MATFQFQSGIKTLEVTNPKGELVKVYSLNVGEKEQTKRWIRELKKTSELSKNIGEDETALDQIEQAEKQIIESVLGAGEWEVLFPVCNNNVIVMLSFVKYLSQFLQESINEKFKEYV